MSNDTFGKEANPNYAVKIHHIVPHTFLDLLSKNTLFEVTSSSSTVYDPYARVISCSVRDLADSMTFATASSASYSIVTHPEYRPQLYVELFAFPDSNSRYLTAANKLYDFYCDTLSGRFHVVAYADTIKHTAIAESNDTVVLLLNMLERASGDQHISSDDLQLSKRPLLSEPLSKVSNPDIAELIKKRKILSVSLLDPFGKHAESHILEYPVVSQITSIPRGVQTRLRNLLLSSDSYKVSNQVINATFLPDAAISFKDQARIVNVLFSFYSDTMKIFMGEREYTMNISPSKGLWISLFIEMFPDDEFIRNYRDE